MNEEDLRVLRSLAPPAARLFAADLHAQARSDRRHLSHTVSGLDVGELRGRQTARWAAGTGGGRRRPDRKPDA